jgi:HAE1 family hydrophobic/amphiphilic exporter-1
MNLSDLSIRNPVFAWMLMLGLMVFGWIGFHRMGVSQLPDIDFPVVTITANWENASPDVMETQVAATIEDAVASVEGIRTVTSTSRLGSTTVTIEFDIKRNVDVAVQDVTSHISQASKDLPKDMDPPIIQKVNPEDQPIMWLALSAKPGQDVSLAELCRYINEHLRDDLSMVPGVGNITLGGYVDPNLRVWLDSTKMAQREITVEDVLDAIGSQHADVPSGYIDSGAKEYNVRVYGEATTPEEFSSLLIPTRRRGGAIYRRIRFSDVGTVEDGTNDVRRISRFQGDRAVGMGIIKQRGTNAVAVADAVDKRIKELEPLLPKGMQIRKVFSSTQFIKDSVRELDNELIRSVVLTSLVCLLFLGSWSATFNVLLAIPTSILGTFIVLYFCGFTINSFTMLGLSLVVGIIVDDAIMVLENIARYREEGFSKMKAAIVGAREITSAAMAASLAILAIFLPVVLMEGIVGKFFFQFGVTISVAVMISLLEALTIAPMRCSQFLEVGASNAVTRVVDKGVDWLRDAYARSLKAALGMPGKVVAASVVIFILSLSLVKTLKKEFIPAQDQGVFIVNVTLPLGVSLDHTNDLFLQKLEPWMKDRPEMDHYYSAIGGFGGGQVNTGIFFVTMKDYDKRPIVDGKRSTQAAFMKTVRDAFSKVEGVDRVSILDMSQAGFSAQRGYPIQFMIQGPDWDKLAQLGAEFQKRMKATGLITDIDTDYNAGMPEIQIRPDRTKASERGITARAIGDTINATIGGLKFGKYTARGKRYDVRVRLVDKDRNSPADIDRIWVRDQFGNVVRLPEVTSRVTLPSLFAITRYNRERAVSVFGNPTTGHSQGEGLAAVQAMAKDILPEGYHLVMSGNAQQFAESFQSLAFVMILGIFVAYMILATQYNSFIHPVTVLVALPFSVTGAFVGLAVARQSLNLYSMIGLILLMGIVKKNSILLVDFTNERRKLGRSVKDALLEACPVRLRPILMTSAATVAGAIPLALASGPGSELMKPMAVTVIGGVLVSTVLTLIVVPCFYELVSQWENKTSDAELKEALSELGELPVEKNPHGEPVAAVH